MTANRLCKSSRDRVIFGVAGGLAEFFSVDPTLVRVAFVLLVFAGGSGLLLYLVLALIMPREETQAATPAETIRENVRHMPEEAAATGHRAREALQGTAPDSDVVQEPADIRGQNRRRNAFGLILIVAGVLALLANLGMFWWFDWGTFWPLALIAIGVAVLARRFRRS